MHLSICLWNGRFGLKEYEPLLEVALPPNLGKVAWCTDTLTISAKRGFEAKEPLKYRPTVPSTKPLFIENVMIFKKMEGSLQSFNGNIRSH